MNFNERFVFDDGGRREAGYSGRAKDCVARSIAIATQLPYEYVRKKIIEFSSKERISKRKQMISHPDKGVYNNTYRRVFEDLGWKWIATMKIGSGCKVHLRADELPSGRIVCSVSHHLVAVIDGVIHDVSDPSRGGKRCVYGYWIKT